MRKRYESGDVQVVGRDPENKTIYTFIRNKSVGLINNTPKEKLSSSGLDFSDRAIKRSRTPGVERGIRCTRGEAL